MAFYPYEGNATMLCYTLREGLGAFGTKFRIRPLFSGKQIFHGLLLRWQHLKEMNYAEFNLISLKYCVFLGDIYSIIMWLNFGPRSLVFHWSLVYRLVLCCERGQVGARKIQFQHGNYRGVFWREEVAEHGTRHLDEARCDWTTIGGGCRPLVGLAMSNRSKEPHSGTEVVLVREGPRAGGAPHSGKRDPTISRLL